MPAAAARCAISADVVDLPLVPVTATNGAPGAWRRRSRQNSSMSPITSTPALCASVTTQCGAGCVSGTPGASTSAASLFQLTLRRSAVGMPAAPAFATLALSSSKATTSAPPARSALALASPELPSPNTATFLPAKVVTRITTELPQFQGRQPRQREHDRDDPETNDDLRLGPAELLEMMMDRRHPKHALTGELVRHHLHDDGDRFEHEQAADDGEHDLMLGSDRDRADHAAERERAGIAHEDRRRRRVEPEKAQARAEHGAAEHGEFAGAGDIMDLQIIGEHRVAAEIRDHAEACRRDHDRNDGQAVETVGQVHRVAGADDDEDCEQHEEPAEIDNQFLEKRKYQRGRKRRVVAKLDQSEAGNRGNDGFDAQSIGAR